MGILNWKVTGIVYCFAWPSNDEESRYIMISDVINTPRSNSKKVDGVD